MRPRDEKRMIMMVDDDPDWRLVAGQWLEHDYDVVGVGSGEDLLAQLDAYEPDLLLLDLDLPGANGITLCRALRAEPRLRELPVLIVTGDGTDQAFAGVVGAGATAYLRKPVGRRRLLTEIKSLL